MNIYFLDNNKDMVDAWNYQLKNSELKNNISVVCEYFDTFMQEHDDIDCVISPANSFGYMDGGYDAAIIDYFGRSVMEKVQEYIKNNFMGEQPIGSSFSLDITDIANKNMHLVHTPTMRTPMLLSDEMIAYTATRSTLLAIDKANCENIVIPAFGIGTGGLDKEIVAKLMIYAIYLYENPTKIEGMKNIVISDLIINALKDKKNCRDVFETIKIYSRMCC